MSGVLSLFYFVCGSAFGVYSFRYQDEQKRDYQFVALHFLLIAIWMRLS
jgi:formate hydrogenlyase subunit 3/multisubunit Na+/H+ antiporter MnhD subunit